MGDSDSSGLGPSRRLSSDLPPSLPLVSPMRARRTGGHPRPGRGLRFVPGFPTQVSGLPSAISQTRFRSQVSSFSSSAFTLVELLVATAILTLLSGLLMSIANQVGSAWREGQSANERRSTGRAILDFMATEIRQASSGISHPEVIDFKSGPGSPPTYSSLATHFVASLPALIGVASTTYPNTTGNGSGNNPFLNPHAVFWQAPIARNTSRGSLATIGYFVRWDGTQARLCRYQVDPADTANYTVFKTPQVNWVTSGNLNAIAPATAPTYQGWFADNVIGLWIRPLDAFGHPIQYEAGVPMKINNGYGFDSRRGYISNGPDGVYNNADDVKVAGPALPPAVEIAIVTIDSTRASRITTGDVTTIQNLALAKAADPSKMWDATDGIPAFLTGLPKGMRQAARCFSTTVYLVNAH